MEIMDAGVSKWYPLQEVVVAVLRCDSERKKKEGVDVCSGLPEWDVAAATERGRRKWLSTPTVSMQRLRAVLKYRRVTD
jgi:hypothetical protein